MLPPALPFKRLLSPGVTMLPRNNPRGRPPVDRHQIVTVLANYGQRRLQSAISISAS